MDYIIYHANCQDGWVAAYVAAKKWPQATLLPLSYGLSPAKLDQVFKDVFHKKVFMVDYSFPSRELMEELARVTKYLAVYDHHVSKKEVLEGLPYAVFDNERSGAGLAWDYLFGKSANEHGGFGAPYRTLVRPWWVNYAEDYDLWKFVLPESHIINAYLMVQPRTIEHWKQVELVSVDEAMKLGTGAKARNDFDVAALLRTIQEGVFYGYKIGVVNTSVAVSEVGEAANKSGYDIALMWYERADGRVSFGLRSKPGVDVSVIAKSYGGGGHKTSAGFEMDIQNARKLLDAILKRGEHAEPTSRCC